MDIDYVLTRGVADILPTKEGLAKLMKKKKITLYLGFDPTGPQLHIGHAVALRKLRQFQDLGHKVIFLIGDFTATIGDPTGKLSTRKVLSREEVVENAKSYQKQASKILRFDGPNPVEIKFNNDWLGKLSAAEFAQLTHLVSFQQMVERDMFQKRIKSDEDIYLSEFIYPLLQAYDSVAMDVDLEIGGTDQLFNMMMGRKLMKKMKQKEKYVLTVPLLTDASGTKIGKSEGNVIGITDEPKEFYGKIMSLGDDAIVNCFRLLTDMPEKDILAIAKNIAAGENPMTYKKQLAYELTMQFNSEKQAQEAQEAFESTFQKREVSDEHATEMKIPYEILSIADLLVQTNLVETRSEAKRLLTQNAIEVDGKVVTNPKTAVDLTGNPVMVRVGKKKFAKIGQI